MCVDVCVCVYECVSVRVCECVSERADGGEQDEVKVEVQQSRRGTVLIENDAGSTSIERE